MRADIVVTVLVGLMLSSVFAWCLCAIGGEADKQIDECFKTKENDNVKKQ